MERDACARVERAAQLHTNHRQVRELVATFSACMSQRGSGPTHRPLFINPIKWKQASEGVIVVGRHYNRGISSPTSSYGSVKAPGTLLCCSGPNTEASDKLDPKQIKALRFGHARKLHHFELLASLSYKPEEEPRLEGTYSKQPYAVRLHNIYIYV